MSEFEQEPMLAVEKEGTVGEVARLALKLGFTAFGGPAAHIAMLHDEVVRRRGWISEQQFLDLLGATNLIPGPNSTEMVIHVGHLRAGWRGLIVAGLCFILPAAAMVLALTWLYVSYGATLAGEWLLYGIKPVIIAIVIQALWGLGRKAVQGPLLGLIGVAVTVLYLLGVDELLLLFVGGLLGMVGRNGGRWTGRGPLLSAAFLPLVGSSGLVLAPVSQVAAFSAVRLFLVFLKIGAVLYGSGYVLLAFLQDDLVNDLGWLTQQQLLDAVAIGQFTPGPLFTTATAIGYMVGGWSGALAATVGIFLPSFLFVAAVNPFVPRLRNSPWMSGLLDGVNVAAVGLMAAVTLELAQATIVDWLTALLAVTSLLLLIRFKVNSAWLVLGGGIVALLYRLLVG